jgi:hypothetical protein
MRKKLLYLVAMIGSFAFTTNAQECDTLALTVGGGSWTSEISWSISADSVVAEGIAGDHSVCLGAGAYSFNMYDSYGDGWNGSTFNLTDADGNVVATGGLETGLEGSVDFVYGDVAIAGCTDATATNYNPLATEDDGSCIAVVEGCTDETATNYNADANTDDGSCTYPYACAEGEYILSMVDSYGDGWGAGNELTVNDVTYSAEGAGEDVCIAGDACLVIVGNAGGSWASEASWSIVSEAGDVASGDLSFSGTAGECSIAGCTDAEALNYNALATEDDGSCEYYSCDATEYTITMSDSYGDGWNGNVLTIGEESFTIESGSEGSAVICLADGVYTVTNGGGSFGSEVSWSIGDALSGGSPFEGTLVVGDVVITGCMDETALNYDANATEDDGSCEYYSCDGTTVTIAVDGGSYQSEVSWSMGDIAGGAPYSEVACLMDGLYTFNMVDSYGDGWNGNVATISDEAGNVIAEGTIDSGDAGSFDFWIGTPVYDCSMAVAVDGEASSNTADNAWHSFEMGDAGSATISIVADSSDFGVSPSVFADCEGTAADLSALTAGTYYVNVTQDIPEAEVGGSDYTVAVAIHISGCTDAGAANYNASATEDDGSCEYIYGCTDVIAENYDETATNDDGSCEYIHGCTDDAALNYEPSATMDDGSCIYVECGGTTATMNLTTGSWASEVGATIANTNGQMLINIESGTLSNSTEYLYDLCLSADSTYQIIMTDSYGDGWNGGTFSITTCEGVYTAAEGGLTSGSVDTIDFTVTACSEFAFGCTDSIAENFDPLADTDDGSCVYIHGCTDEVAENYDATATMDDGSCEYILGCTNPEATNYDPAATQDDDTCITPIPCDSALTGVAFVMVDSYGDGWNGNTYSIADADGNIAAEGTLETGSQAVDSVCIADGCYFVTVGGGSYESEVSWAILDNMNGTSLVSGGAPSTEPLSLNSDCNIVEGCTDDFAINYNPEANIDNGTCEYTTSETCEEAIALTSGVEYPGAYGAQVYFSVTLEEAAFLTLEGAAGAGSWYSPVISMFTDCGDQLGTGAEAGVMEAGTYYIKVETTSFWGEGNPFVITATVAPLVEGCTDSYAANYDETANIDNGSCEYPCEGVVANLNVTTGSWASEVYWELLDDSGIIVANGGDGAYSNNTPYDVPLCLELGKSYTMNSYDSYGDGWNGGTYALAATCGEGDAEFSYIVANNNGESPSDLESTAVNGFHLEAAEVFSLVDCDSVVAGCMDETMFNYNPEANVTDGNCVPYIYGCTDSTALNFNAEANTEDESCVYGCEGEYVTVTVNTVSYGSEVTWELYNAAGDTLMFGGPYGNNETHAEQICLGFDEEYVFSAHDSYGDGWNGGSFSISSCADVMEGGVAQVSGMPEGDGADYAFTVTNCADIIPGCMIETAINYNAEATHSDGSCEFAVPSLLTPADGYVMEMSVEDTVEYSWEVLETQAGPSDGYSIFWSTDSSDLEGSIILYVYNTDTTSWDGLSTQFYDIFVDNGYGAGDSFDIFWWVCNDINYVSGVGYTGSSDQFTQANTITLTLSQIWGCTDETALNFDANATDDDGSCTYPCTDNTVNLSDSYGDGWNGNALTISYTDNAGMAMDTTVTIETGFDAMVCLDMDETMCTSFAWTTGSWTSETSWTLTDAEGTVLAEGAAGSTPDAIGCNVGCMDPCYAEYDETAQINDGCNTYICGGTAVTMEMYDSWGDGWNGNTYVITDADGNVVAEGGLESGSEGFEDVILEDGCYTVTVDGGSYQSEVSWVLGELASGGAPGSVNFSLNAECEFAIPGCMDPAAANYDETATEDDGSCEYEGCTDPAADNYDEIATIDDGSCMYSCGEGEAQIDILITTDTYAGETGFTLSDDQGGVYSVAFTSANNTSTVTSTFCVDNGSNMTFVLTDSYGDGIISGGYEIYVCEESIQTDFALGAFDAVSYEFVATCGDIYGCMDPEALNYNSAATVDDGSCEYPMVCNDVLATIVVSTVDYASEMGWSLVDADGNQVAGIAQAYENNSEYSQEVCLMEGADYQFNMADSYGDGWNGGSFVINSDCGELAAGALETGEADFVAFTASCDGGSETCAVPASWDVTVTGANHTIMISGDALVTIDDVQVADGSAVGVFFTNSNGDLQCAGYSYLNGETVQIAAMGDDTTTEEIDGLAAGETFTWMIWDATMCEEWAAAATYAPGSSDTYTTNAISAVATIANVPAGPTCQTIDLPSGWSMFSTYMIAADMDLKEVLAPIVDNVIIAKDNNGSAYLVAWDFNGVGDMEVGQGYQIKTDAAVSLEICGEYAFPEENPINLTAGWNMIGYLRTEPADAAAVLESINATENLVIAKDYNGSAYLPAWGFNGIGDMVPGQGYQLKTETADVLTYNANDVDYRMASSEVIENNVKNFAQVSITDNNMTVVIEDAAWDVVPTEGSEVAAFDKAGNMIGSAVYSSPVTVLTVWGDDATTEAKDGLAVAEAVSFKVWSNGVARDFEVAEWAEGSASYNVDAINVASSIVISAEVANTISSDRELVRVINVLGQEVDVNDDTFKGEVLFNVYNDGTVEKFVK